MLACGADNWCMRLSPSALHDFLACRYLTWLEQEHQAGRLELVEIPRQDAEFVRERGVHHEEPFPPRADRRGAPARAHRLCGSRRNRYGHRVERRMKTGGSWCRARRIERRGGAAYGQKNRGGESPGWRARGGRALVRHDGPRGTKIERERAHAQKGVRAGQRLALTGHSRAPELPPRANPSPAKQQTAKTAQSARLCTSGAMRPAPALASAA